MDTFRSIKTAADVIALLKAYVHKKLSAPMSWTGYCLSALVATMALLLCSPVEAASKSGSYITGTTSRNTAVQLWVPLDLAAAGDVAQSVTITRLSARGDLDHYLSLDEYVDFSVDGSNWDRVAPNSTNCSFSIAQSYSGSQPAVVSEDGVQGFYFYMRLGPGVDLGYCGSSNNADIQVSYTVEYTPDPNNLSIGGSLSGLGSGKTVVLQNNGETLSLSSNGAFTFPTRVASGDSYAVTVTQQPVGETCSISNGSGVATASVTDIAVTCEDPFDLAIGDSKQVPPMPKDDVVTYKIDARQATSASKIRIGARGFSGDLDLFVGDGFEPNPYQNFTCKSDTTGTEESCELPSGRFYYATLYAFTDARSWEIYAEALGAPDAPVITRADAADEGAKLYFTEPADNGAAIESFTASCSLATTASDQFASYVEGKSGLDAGHWRIESVEAAAAPRWVDTAKDELLLRAPKWEREPPPPPSRLSLQGFGGMHELTVTFSEVTDTGDMFLVGTVLHGGEFSLLLTPGGQVVGRVKLDDDALLLDPSSVGGLSTLRSAARSGLTVAPMGRDDLEPPELSPDEVAAGDFVPSNDGHTQIDLLVLYPSGYSGALSNAQYMVSYANYIFNRSGTNTQFVVQAYSQYSPSTFDPLDDIRLSSRVASLRDEYRADLVAFVAPLDSAYGNNNNYCGQAWVIGGNSSSYTTSAVRSLGYSVSFYGSAGGSYCTEETFAHELGHNMGAAHDQAHSNVSPHRYNGYGDGIQGIFGTVMSYISPEQAYFSSPNLFCAGGYKCGRYSYTNVVSAIQYVRGTTAAAYPGDGPAGGGGPGEEYTVTPSAGYGGTVTPSSPQKGFKGNQKTFNFQPSDGYLLDTVTGSCSGVREGNQYVVTIGDKNCTFTGNFDVDGKSYGVRVSASTGGSVSPAGNFRVRPFDMLSVSITPDDGFSVASIGGSCPGSYSAWSRTFSTEEITEDCTISVKFAKTGNSVVRSRSPITVDELTAGVEYKCSVSASNFYGQGTASASVLVTPFKTTAPGRPTIKSIDADDGELWISFTPGGTGNLTVSYTATCGDVSSLPSSGSPITVSGLTNGVAVECSVTASNSKGSSTSATYTATPDEQIRGLPIWLLYQATQ